MTTNINLELYEFLKDKETHLYRENSAFTETIIAIALINFYDLDEFVKIVGYNYFVDDGGMDVKLQYGNICVELNEIFEYEGNTILEYKNCFEEDEFKEYEEKLKIQYEVR